jgi:predicted PurR-regulated permease PerM
MISSHPADSAMPANLGWRSIALFLFTLAVSALCGAIFFPFLPALTWAVALAVATRTPYVWLARRTRNPTLAAALGVLLVVVLILVPAFFLVQSLVQRGMQVVSLIQAGDAERWLQETRDQYPKVEHLIEQISETMDLQQAAQSAAGFLAGRVRALVTGSATIVTQIVMMLFALFFLFRDGKEALHALRWLLPLNESQTNTLLGRMTDALTATLQGRVFIAALQGTLGGLMFWILGIPEILLWTTLMALLATIPSLGTFLVWMPVAVYLVLAGHWIKAIVLCCWGALVIGTIDNFLYPTLIGSKLKLHTAPLFFSVLGGIASFGVTGIVLGPLILTALVTLLQIWKNPPAANQQ